MTNIFKELINSKDIFEDLDKNTLRSVIKSFNNTSMSVDDLAQKFGGLNTETIAYLKSAKRGEASLEGLSASMTSASIGAKLLSVALNALSGLAISLIIKGFTWALDELIVTLDEQKQKLDEAITAYEESKSELEQINDELKTTGERIDELNGKENLTFTEQDELEKLIKTNDELERKIYLLEQANKEAEKEVATEAQNTYDKYTNDRTLGAVEQIEFYADSSLLEGVSWDNFKGDLSWLVAQYKNQQEILTNAHENGWTQIEEQTKSNLELLEGYMSDASLDYQDLYDKISGISDYAMTDELKVAKQDLDDILDIVAEILGYGGQRSETSFDNIWNSEDFSQYKTELETLAKEGKLDAGILESNENYKKLLEDTGTTAEDTAQHINALVDEIGKTGQEVNKIDDSRTKMISSINDMSEGFEELDKIYSSIKDEDPFDFKLLDDDNFKETFGELDTYADFIEQITSNSDDIEACQSAFNNLVTEWINEIGILDNVTEENQKLTVAMLKQMGVSNAEEVATKALEKSKTKLAAEEEFLTKKKEDATITSENLTAATYAEVYALWSESTASEATQQYLAQLALSKLDVQNIKLNTKSDIDNIIALAKAAGTSTEYVNALQSALSSLQSASKASATNTSKNYLTTGTQLDAKINNKAWSEELKAAQEQENKVKQAQQELQNVLSSIQNVSLNPSDFYANVDYTGGSKSNGGSGSSSKDTQEQFDWIEIAISRLQRTITNLGKTVSATWKSWTDRNSALKSQISAVTSEINLQQQAADKYLSLANGVGLSGTYKELVRNGSLNISTITDENTIDAIKKYKEYYENYLSALDAKQDAEDELANLVREDFDMIAKQFDSEISLVEANISTLEAYIDQTEMKGNLVSKNYYSAMYAEEQKNLAYLQQKYDQLSNKLSNGTIVQGSEEFNEMATEIKEVSKAIIESNTALEEYQKTMRELDWEVFDLIEGKIGNVTEESEFLIDLLSNSKLFNDNGSITSQGQATLGLHVANMKVYESQVKDYADELAKLDSQFANDSLDKNYLERREELLELQRDSILAMKSEQQSIQDLWSEGYSKLLDYMQKVSDKYRDMMSQISDTRDFEKSVKSQVEEISRLQNILDSYRNDNSEEGKMHKQEIGEQLEEARETLEETEREQYLKELDIMLTAMMDDAEEWQNARLDDVSGLIQSVVDGVDENASSIEDTLKSEISAVGGTLTTEMQNLWNGADGIKGVVGGVNDTLLCIKTLVQSMVDKSNVEANKNANNTTTNTTPTTKPTTTPKPTTTTQQSTAKAITVGGLINAGSATIYSNANGGGGGRQYYRANPIYTVLGEKNGYLKVRHQSLSSGTTGWFKKSDVKAYKTGGLVDYTGLAWVDGQKGKPEAFLNANDTELFAKLKDSLEIVSKTNMFDAIQSYAKLPNFVSNGNMQNHEGDITFDIKMYGINDPQEMAQQVKKIYQDNIGNVRKTIRADVYGGMLNKNSLTRYKY